MRQWHTKVGKLVFVLKLVNGCSPKTENNLLGKLCWCYRFYFWKTTKIQLTKNLRGVLSNGFTHEVNFRSRLIYI